MNTTLRIPLVQLAHARSGDKADWVDFGLFPWNEAGREFDPATAEVGRLEVDLHPALLPEGAGDDVLHAQGALQGGGARNLRLDNLGKAMGAALLRMEIEVSAEELAQAQKSPRRGWWPAATSPRT